MPVAHLNEPGVVGVFPRTGEFDLAVPEDATILCRDRSSLWSWGKWRHGELRTVSRPEGWVVTIGRCLVDDGRWDADARRALESGRAEQLTTWPGSYLVLMMRAGELTAFTDLSGQYPLYYSVTGEHTVVGATARATALAAGTAERPDVLTLATQTFLPAVTPLGEGRSVFAEVAKLGGGQALRVNAAGGRRVWTYEALVPKAETSLAEGAVALGSALGAAVRERALAGSRLTVDFSGGLDSTSVAFLAANCRQVPLRAFTYHHPGAPAGDLVYAERYASLDSRINLEVVLGAPETFTYHDFPAHAGDSPDPAAVSWSRTRLRLSRIAADGKDEVHHLTGEGADALLAAPPAYLADLAGRGRLRRLYRHSRTLGRQRGESPVGVLAESVRLSGTSVGSALRHLADQLEEPRDRSLRWLDTISWWPAPGAESTWLTRSMRSTLAELARTKAASASWGEGRGVGDFVALGELHAAGAVQRQLSETARGFGVWPQAPFLDNDVVRACTGVPAHRRADPAKTKPLLAAAMSGLVPGEVFTRATKGNYSGEDYRGARLALVDLKQRLSRSRLAELGIIEPGAVMASLDRWGAGAPFPFAVLNRLLGAELWLEAGAARAHTAGRSVRVPNTCP